MKTFLKFVVFRLFSLVFIFTQFVPDEYWQTLEVAHFHAFGYGHMTWEFREGIRSYLYPSIFYVLYKILAVLRLDNIILLIYLPRALQAILVAYADQRFLKIGRSLNISSKWLYIAIFTDWYSFYSCSRTLINTFETSLVIIGLSFFPWQSLSNRDFTLNKWFPIIVCVTCFSRVTACVIWAPFCFYWFLVTPNKMKKHIIFQFMKYGIWTLALLTLTDCLMYGRLILTPINFIKFNLFYGVADFYGTHPYWWYFFNGLPVVLGLLFIPFAISLLGCLNDSYLVFTRNQHVNHVKSILLVSSCFSVCLYSAIPHKEFRFIHPVAPFMTLLALQSLDRIRSEKFSKFCAVSMAMVFMVSTLFFGVIHQRGPLAAVNQLAADASQKPNATSILFLMPCHSTPLYSHIHVPVPTRFITCEPPLTKEAIDESEDFFSAPLPWLQNYWSDRLMPSHVVMFDSLLPTLGAYLNQNEFAKSSVIFHTLFPETRTGREILIFRSIHWENK